MAQLAFEVFEFTSETADHQLVADDLGNGVVVMGLSLWSSAGAVVNFHGPGVVDVSLSGHMRVASGTQFTLPIDREGWFATEAGAALHVTVSAAVSGIVRYRLT